MRKELWAIIAAGLIGWGIAGCVARVETDPAPAKVNVDVDPPPNVDVKVD
jgi:hypothetical protein